MGLVEKAFESIIHYTLDAPTFLRKMAELRLVYSCRSYSGHYVYVLELLLLCFVDVAPLQEKMNC